MRVVGMWGAVRGVASAAAAAASSSGRGSLLVKCHDTFGVVAAVATAVARQEANMRAVDVHIEPGGAVLAVDGARRSVESGWVPGARVTRREWRDECGKATFVCRFAFDWRTSTADAATATAMATLEDEVEGLVTRWDGAAVLTYLHSGGKVAFEGGRPRAVVRAGGRPRVGILAGRLDHCLVDLLTRWRTGELGADVAFVASNHERDPGTSDVRRRLAQWGVPYHFVAHGEGPAQRARWEGELLAIAQSEGADFLALARYMQVLSSDFLGRYPGDIINIHHGLLPGFKGANPYRQAFDAGVKLIGASAHFVTEELDEGPIIEQRTATVSHRTTMAGMRHIAEDLEAAALRQAVRLYAHDRIARVRNRTIIFAEDAVE